MKDFRNVILTKNNCEYARKTSSLGCIKKFLDSLSPSNINMKCGDPLFLFKLTATNHTTPKKTKTKNQDPLMKKRESYYDLDRNILTIVLLMH